jgi:ABC-2 type transport system permease protein
MIFALYTVILLYGQMVATNVANEKSSRAMELLITSAKPTSMMFGKVIASCLAGLLQLVAIFGTSFVCYNLNKSYWGENVVMSSLFDMPLMLLIYMLVFFILGFAIYAFLFGAVGSTVSRLEDINSAVQPITLLFVAAFMIVMFSLASDNVDSMLMIVCSYVPLTSPMAMFSRIAMSVVPIYQIVISIAILIAFAFCIGVLSAKIYRIGVLMYGTPPKPAALIRALIHDK